jgi:predicted transcriptional regulator
MARKKEGFRRGSSAKPKRHLRDVSHNRGAGRAPSIGSRSDSKERAKEPEKGEAKAREPVVKEEELDSNYNTVMDDIVALIEQQESVSLTELSKKFNVPYARLEEWGRILDKNGLLELEYPMVGDVMLRKKGYAAMVKEKKDEKRGKAKKAELKGEKKEEKQGEVSKEGEIKADANQKGVENKEAQAQGDIEKKKASKKRFKLIMLVFVIIIIALVGVLVYSLSRGGYIQLV